VDDGSSGPHKSHKVRSRCGRLSLGQRRAASSSASVNSGVGHRMPTVSGGPGRISDGLTEAINLLIKKILRVETRTLQILTTTRGIGFPYAKQVVRITRERVVTATRKTRRRGRLWHLQPAARASPASENSHLAAPAFGY
jgi:hypothetical protein